MQLTLIGRATAVTGSQQENGIMSETNWVNYKRQPTLWFEHQGGNQQLWKLLTAGYHFHQQPMRAEHVTKGTNQSNLFWSQKSRGHRQGQLSTQVGSTDAVLAERVHDSVTLYEKLTTCLKTNWKHCNEAHFECPT